MNDKTPEHDQPESEAQASVVKDAQAKGKKPKGNKSNSTKAEATKPAEQTSAPTEPSPEETPAQNETIAPDNTTAEANPQNPSPQKPASQNPNPKAGKPNKQQRQRIPVSKTAVLSLLISTSLLVAVGGAAWYGYQHLWPTLSSGQLAKESWVTEQLDNQQQSQAGQVNSLARQVQSELNRSASQTQGELQIVERKLSDMQSRSVQTNARLDRVSNQLEQMQGVDRTDWLLAEAEYLLRLANQRLITMQDIKSAQSLLVQADTLLGGMDEYSLLGVREALTAEIASLNGTTPLDPTEAWLTLNALASQVGKLPIVTGRSSNMASLNTPREELPEGTTVLEIFPEATEVSADVLKQNLQQEPFWEQVKMTMVAMRDKVLFFVRDVSNTFLRQFLISKDRINVGPVMMSPDQELFVRQNLLMMIEQSQLALLQKREVIYRASMNDIEQWLNKWFATDSTEVTAFREALAPLLNAPVNQSVPDISQSLAQLKAFVSNRSKPSPAGKAHGGGQP